MDREQVAHRLQSRFATGLKRVLIFPSVFYLINCQTSWSADTVRPVLKYMYWYKIFLSTADLENMRSVDLVKEVGRRSAREGYPIDFALFRVTDNRYVGATYYLPPSALKVCPGILTDFNAVRDDVPSRTSLTIAVGENGALDYWFRSDNIPESISARKRNSRPKSTLLRLVLN
jgi:hypothetical protein